MGLNQHLNDFYTLLEHSHQVCQMPNIWHLTHQTPLFKPHEVFQMCQNFATCYNTVSYLRRYGHQCQKYFGLFNYFSLSSHQISLSSSATHISLSVSSSLITDLTMPRHWPPHHAASIFSSCHAGLFDLVDLFSSRHAGLISSCHVDLITPLTTTTSHRFVWPLHHAKLISVWFKDAGLCRWMWVCLIWWMWVCASGGFGMWVCLI